MVCKKTKIITETKIEVDTIIKVRVDTVTIIDSLPLQRFLAGKDTLKLENKVAAAKTYFNLSKQKIVLELQGKGFDLPVKIQATKTVTKEIPVKKSKWYLYFGAGFLFSLLLILILKR